MTDRTADQGASGRDPNSGHGHVWKRPDGFKARCGGPGLCAECSRDMAQAERWQASLGKQVEADNTPFKAEVLSSNPLGTFACPHCKRDTPHDHFIDRKGYVHCKNSTDDDTCRCGCHYRAASKTVSETTGEPK